MTSVQLILYQISVSLFIQFQDTKQLCTTLSAEILSNTQFTEVNLKSKSNSSHVLYVVVVESLLRLKIGRLATYQLLGGPLLNTYNSLILLKIIIPKNWFTCSPTWVLNRISKHFYQSPIFRKSDGNLAPKSMRGYDMSSF